MGSLDKASKWFGHVDYRNHSSYQREAGNQDLHVEASRPARRGGRRAGRGCVVVFWLEVWGREERWEDSNRSRFLRRTGRWICVRLLGIRQAGLFRRGRESAGRLRRMGRMRPMGRMVRISRMIQKMFRVGKR